MTTADAAVRAALSVVGQTEDPPGSNHCPITRELDATFPRVPLSGGGSSTRGGTSWCGSFTFWALWKSGYPIDTQRGCLVVNGVDIWDFYTPADVNAWKKAGRWLDWRETPPVGALVYYDWQGTHGTTSLTDHVGMVIDVSPDGTFISTVEGNTSPGGFVSNGGGVYAFGPDQPNPGRPRSSMVGFGLPLYTTTPEEPPMFDYLGLLPDGSYFLRCSGNRAVRVTGEELATVHAGKQVYTVPKGTNWEWWITQELKAYDAAVK